MSTQNSITASSLPPEDTVVIVGVGLIGGSLGAALKQRRAARWIIGVGRDAARLEAARRAGLIDEATINFQDAARRASVIVFCTPVDKVAEGVRSAAAAVSGCPASDHSAGAASQPSLLLTDAGSVKGPICEALADVPNFLGAHPIAGSHRHGFEAADPNLYENKVCVLTPQATAAPQDLARLERFWQSVGMKTIRMSPTEHDAALAMTSHLPHIVAAALAQTLTLANQPLTGTGFRDTTRVAAGDPELWTGILLNNAAPVIVGIDQVQRQLEKFRSALQQRDAETLTRLLLEGQRRRESLDQPS